MAPLATKHRPRQFVIPDVAGVYRRHGVCQTSALRGNSPLLPLHARTNFARGTATLVARALVIGALAPWRLLLVQCSRCWTTEQEPGTNAEIQVRLDVPAGMLVFLVGVKGIARAYPRAWIL